MGLQWKDVILNNNVIKIVKDDIKRDQEQQYKIDQQEKQKDESIIDESDEDIIQIDRQAEEENEKTLLASRQFWLEVVQESYLQHSLKYTDTYPLFAIRKKLLVYYAQLSHFCYLIQKSPLFENLVLIVIFFNCIHQIDQTSQPITQNNQYVEESFYEMFFIYFYTIEMFIKIMGLGLQEYLTGLQNMMDIFIVITSWIPIIFQSANVTDFSGLKFLRVLRPLRTVKNIKSLKVIVLSIIRSLPLLKSIFMILMFVYVIFAILMLQLMKGTYKQQCFYAKAGLPTGLFSADSIPQEVAFCRSTKDCESTYICGKALASLKWDFENFDTFFNAFLMVYQVISLEGWSDIMYVSQKTYSEYTFVFYWMMIIIGSFFLMNLVIAILANEFVKAQEQTLLDLNKEKTSNAFSYRRLIHLGVYTGNKMSLKKKIKVKTNEDKKVDLLHKAVGKLKKKSFTINKPKLKGLARASTTETAEKKEEIKKSEITQNSHEKNSISHQENSIDISIASSELFNKLGEQKNAQSVYDHLQRIEYTEYSQDQYDVNIDEYEQPAHIPNRIRHFNDNQMANYSHNPTIIASRLKTINDDVGNDQLNINVLPNGNLQTFSKIVDTIQLNSPYQPRFKFNNANNDDDEKTDNVNALKNPLQQVTFVNQEDQIGLFPHERKPAQEKVLASKPTAIMAINQDELNEYKQQQDSIKRNKESTINKKVIKRPYYQKKNQKIYQENLYNCVKDNENDSDENQSNMLQFLQKNKQTQGKEHLIDIYEYIDEMRKKILQPDEDLQKQNILDVKAKKLEDYYYLKKIKGKNLCLRVRMEQEVLAGSLNDVLTSDLIYKGMREKYVMKTKYRRKKFKFMYQSNVHQYINNIDMLKEQQKKIRDTLDIIRINQPLKIRGPATILSLVDAIVCNQHDHGYDPKDNSRNQSNSISLQDNEVKDVIDQNGQISLGDRIALMKKNKLFLQDKRKDESLKKELSEQKSNFKGKSFLSKQRVSTQKSIAKVEIIEKQTVCTKKVKTISLRENKQRLDQIMGNSEKLQVHVNQMKTLKNKILQEEKYIQIDENNNKKRITQIKLKIIQQLGSYSQMNNQMLKEIISDKYVEEIVLKKKDKFKFSHDIFNQIDFKQKSAIQTETLRLIEDNVVVNELLNEESDKQRGLNSIARYKQSIKSDVDNQKPNLNVYWSADEVLNHYNYLEIREQIANQINFQTVLYKRLLNLKVNFQKDSIFIMEFNNLVDSHRKLQQYKIFLIKQEKKNEKILNSLNYSSVNYTIWLKGSKGIINAFRRLIYKITINKYFDTMILLIVLINTTSMSLDGYLSSTQMDQAEYIQNLCSIVFFIEMIMKMISLGIQQYLSDGINIFDGSLVGVSIIEYINGNSNSSFSSLRTLRILRVLRVTRLLRSLRYMQVIIKVLAATINSALYIALLFALIIFVYSVLGIQIYKGKLTKTNGKDNSYRQSFDTFVLSFFTIFQMMTVENWNQILTACLVSEESKIITILYLFSCQIILAYILHNLFQGIFLSGFDDADLLNHDKEPLFDDVECQHCDTNLIYCEMPLLIEGVQEEVNDTYQYFRDEYCAYSLFIFSQQNTIRKTCYWLSKHRYFEACILCCIVISSVTLALDTYIDYSQISNMSEQDKAKANILMISNIIFTLLFMAEMNIKVISQGLFMESTSYLRASWNQLDMLVVMMSLLELSYVVFRTSTENSNFKVLKVLRLFRILRPLRFISRNQGMKIVVIALLESFGGIANVCVFIVLCWVMLSILGMNFVKDSMQVCSVGDTWGINKEECLNRNGQMKSVPWNMDNIYNSMLTIFVFATLEGWNDLVYSYIDSTQKDHGPVFQDRLGMLSYNLTVIYLSAFFFVDLFVGVVFLNYVLAEHKIKSHYVTDDQQRWVKLNRHILQIDPHYDLFKPIKSKFRSRLVKALQYKGLFDNFITLIIVCNVIQLCCVTESSSEQEEKINLYINYVFNIVFIAEAVIKLIAYKINYFKMPNNKLDFILAVLSIVDLLIDRQIDQRGQSASFTSFIKLLRVTRVTRVLKLIKKFKNLLDLIKATKNMLPAMLNILALMFLMFFIFGVIATNLFSSVQSGYVLNADSVNFKTFGNSFIMMFRMSTGEDWHLIMYDCNAYNPYSAIYFIIYVILIQYIMVNLFVLVIIREFDENYYNVSNPMIYYEETFQQIKEVCSQYSDEKHKAIKLHHNHLVSILMRLDKPAGVGFKDELQETTLFTRGKNNIIQMIKSRETINQQLFRKKKHYMKALKVLIQMKLQKDKDGYVFFNEFFYQILKIAFKPLYEKNLNLKGNLFLKELHCQTLAILFKKNYRINILSSKKLSKLLRQNQVNNVLKDIKQKQIDQKKPVESKLLSFLSPILFRNKQKQMEKKEDSITKENIPLNDYVYIMITFKSWIAYQKKTLSVVQMSEEQKQEIKKNTIRMLFDYDQK